MTKAVLFDIDGTAVGETEKASKEVIAAVQMLREKKVPIGWATGRNYLEAARILGQNALPWDFIMPNIGSVLVDYMTAEHIDPLYISEDAVRAFFDACNGVDGHIRIGGDETGIQRLQLHGINGGRTDQVQGRIRRPDIRLEAYESDKHNGRYILDACHPDASKGRAILMMAKRLSIPPQNIAAVGDNQPDIAMISLAGLGIAMGQAPKEVREAAGRTVRNVQVDGLAQAIEEVILPWLDA